MKLLNKKIMVVSVSDKRAMLSRTITGIRGKDLDY